LTSGEIDPDAPVTVVEFQFNKRNKHEKIKRENLKIFQNHVF